MVIRPVAIGLIMLCMAACGTAATPSLPASSPGVQTPAATILLAGPTLAATVLASGNTGWPACAALAGQKIELSRDFAPGFPFPSDIRLIRFVTETNGTYTQQRIVGITPFGVQQADGFIQAGLASAGYRLTSHDSEQIEADGLFMGNGWIGSYQVRVFDDCEQATTWTVQVLKL